MLRCKDGIINRKELISTLQSNPTLARPTMPKLLFIQSCQGDEEDQGVAVIEESDSDSDGQPICHYPNMFIFSSCYPGNSMWSSSICYI